MKTYIVNQPLKYNGISYGVGDSINLPDNHATFLLMVAYVTVMAAKIDDSTQEPPTPDDNTQHTGGHDEQTPPVNQVPADDEGKSDSLSGHGQDGEQSPDVPADTQSAPSDKPNYDGLTKAELSAELTKRGIDHNAKAKNDELVGLLVADDESRA